MRALPTSINRVKRREAVRSERRHAGASEQARPIEKNEIDFYI
ncbi:hypothetical protein ASZ90_011261 [hydrocarbon metagenome]|uniref:Uncharacterized protein n=1 Tax=hydrocarbon metagenome TaxID=938273 RepID=A0A0W8FDP5_9ZZZZ